MNIHYQNLKCLFYTIFIILFSGSMSVAQNEIDTIQAKNNLVFIRTFDTLINLKLNIHSEYERFMQDDGAGYHVDLRPNISLSNKISVSYRYISFGFSFAPKFIPGNNDNDIQGKTRGWSFGFGLNGRIVQDLNVGFVKGFYLKNTQDFIPDWIEGNDPYILLPDIKIAYIRGLTGYKFNPNFSLKAIHSQTEAQQHSAGSFIPFLSYDYFEIDNKSDDVNQSNSQKSANLRMIANLGYSYTFVINKHIYLSASISPAFGFQRTRLTTRMPLAEDNISRYTDAVFRIQEKIGIGYQSDRFFAGAEGFFAQSKLNENKTALQLQVNNVYFQVFLGYRFVSPRFIRKTTDEVKSLAPKSIQGILE